MASGVGAEIISTSQAGGQLTKKLLVGERCGKRKFSFLFGAPESIIESKKVASVAVL